MSRRLKILTAAGIVLGLAVLTPVVRHYQLRFAVEKYIAEMKARGEPMELAQVVPPPVPPEKNSAPMFWEAVSLLHTNWGILDSNSPPVRREVARGKAMVGWMQPDVQSFGCSNSWQEIKDALAQDANALTLLSRLTNNSSFDFHLQYDQRFQMRITNLVDEKNAVRLLSASAIYNLHTGDTAAAVSNVQTALVLVKGTDDERTVISQLVRIAMAAIASGTTWEILQATNVTDATLALLQDDWSQLEFVRAYERSLPVEREGAVTTAALWRKSNSELDRYFDLRKNLGDVFGRADDSDSFLNEVTLNAKVFLWRYWWSYPDELRYLKGIQVLVDTVHSVGTDGNFVAALNRQNVALDQLGISKLTNSIDTLLIGPDDFHSMLSGSVLTLGATFRKVMRAEAEKQITVTAIALKRYQMKHGNYPHDLNSLVPAFVSTVPRDPVDGQLLRYRVQPDGNYLLYSIGENGIDDGGDSALQKGAVNRGFFWESAQALDWVWPQPATETEIQNYYAPPPK